MLAKRVVELVHGPGGRLLGSRSGETCPSMSCPVMATTYSALLA